MKPRPAGRDRSGEILHYGGLLLLGIGATLVFYLSVLGTAQVIVAGSLSDVEDRRQAILVVLGAFMVLGLAPLLHFSVAELPQLAVRQVRASGRHVLAFAALCLIGGFLLLY